VVWLGVRGWRVREDSPMDLLHGSRGASEGILHCLCVSCDIAMGVEIAALRLDRLIFRLRFASIPLRCRRCPFPTYLYIMAHRVLVRFTVTISNSGRCMRTNVSSLFREPQRNQVRKVSRV